MTILFLLSASQLRREWSPRKPQSAGAQANKTRTVIGAAATLEGGRCDFGEPVAISNQCAFDWRNCRSGRVQRGLVPSPKNRLCCYKGGHGVSAVRERLAVLVELVDWIAAL